MILQVPHVDYSDSDFITSYVEYVKQQLGLANFPLPTAVRLGIISRKNRRRIINEDELVEISNNAIKSELIEYSGLSFREQVSNCYLETYCCLSHFIHLHIFILSFETLIKY